LTLANASSAGTVGRTALRLPGGGWRAWGPLLGLLLVVGGIFSEALLGDRVFFQRDIHAYWYPNVEAFVRAVSEGAWPVWNPYPAFGRPLAPDPNFQVAYPLTWLNLVLRPAAYFKLYVVVHCLGAGLGVHLLCRRLGLGATASFLAAGTWIASGPLLSSVSLLHHFAGATWMPWVLLALHRSLARGTWGSTLALGAVAAGQALAGSADMCFMTGLLAVGHCCGFVACGPVGPRTWRAIRVAAVSLAFAMSLSAVQWLPAAALALWGSRGTQSAATSLYWSLHPVSLLDFVVPRLVADFPLDDAARAVVFESREPLLLSLYLGVPAALLAAWALVAPDQGQKKAAAWTAAGFAFFLLAALGRHAPLLPALAQWPVFSVFRYPTKYLLPASLLWAVLAGLGAEAWLRDWEKDARRRAMSLFGPCGLAGLALLPASPWLTRALWGPEGPLGWMGAEGAIASVNPKVQAASAIAAVSCLLFWLRRLWPAPPRRLVAAFLAVVLGNLAWAGRDVNPVAPPELMKYRPPILDAVSSPGREPRVYVLPEPMAWFQRNFVANPAGWRPEWGWVLGSIDLLWPPIPGRWRVQGSYDGDFSGLAHPALSALSLKLSQESPSLALKLLQMASVDYVVALHTPAAGELRQVAEFPSVYASPIRLFLVPRPLPRVYGVGSARFVSEPSSFVALEDPSFDPRAEVILPQGAQPVRKKEDFRGDARVSWRRSDAVAVETDFSAPGYLVIVEAYDPGWRATVDGRPVEVRRANLLFRAVEVPEGRHHVELSYRPPGLLWGALLSASAAGTGVISWIHRWRGRRGPVTGEPSR
jgi:hypothetical protein